MKRGDMGRTIQRRMRAAFSGLINGQRFALQLLKAPGDELDSDDTGFDYTPDMVVRAKREVETMRRMIYLIN